MTEQQAEQPTGKQWVVLLGPSAREWLVYRSSAEDEAPIAFCQFGADALQIASDHNALQVAVEALEKVVAMSDTYPPCKGKPWDDVEPCDCDGSNSGDMEDHGNRDGIASTAAIARAALQSIKEQGR